MGEAVQHDVALDPVALDELGNSAARVLLDTIDSLRELQIGEIVDLPQIIVVGDQSSGKSSVLEAISGVRFPTKGDVCTRFATELVIRAAPKTKVELISESNLCAELEQLAAANQGNEFPGLPNGNLCFQFFKMQVRPWSGIADFYLDQVIGFAKSFVEELFMHIIGADEQTADRVLASYVDLFFKAKRAVLKTKLQEVLRPYANAYGPPLDVEFHSTLQLTTTDRETARIASLLEETFPAAFTDKGGKGITRKQVTWALRSVKRGLSSEFGIKKVINMTMTHFQISLETFAQNVVNLAVENCLISDLHTILTPSMVVRMTEKRLRELASESEDIRTKRQSIQQEIKILRSGLSKCQQSRPPQRTVLPEAFANTPPATSSWGSSVNTSLWPTLRNVTLSGCEGAA